MNEHTGWLYDIYGSNNEITIWLLEDGGERCRLSQPFPVTFYAAGSFPRLRQLWRYLHSQPLAVQLGRTQRTDLFTGTLEVMEIQTAGPADQKRLFRQVLSRFPDLDYYDADIPLALRYAAAFNVFPLARCRIAATADGTIKSIVPLDSCWDLHPTKPPLRIIRLEPNTDPDHQAPTHLRVTNDRGEIKLALEPARPFLISLQALLKRHDPDILLTRWGDTWLLPYLLDLRHQLKASFFNLNRDESRPPLRRKANSYFTYGQVVYRGQQVHLFGRWHIDQTNAMMFGEYGLAGILEQARVTALPVQEIARKSPGAGITAMQMLVALRRGILVPFQKQQAERSKTARDLIRADRGGLVYQPLIGLHQNVTEIDFTSMYPSIMVKYNISPETVNCRSEQTSQTKVVPELGMPIDQYREGLVPATLKPLLAKRIALKQELAAINPHDCRYQALKARSNALKWLLVVCFGYLGYKNARFGRIEGHEAVTAYGREMLLRAKEAAEDLGYTVLHMYVDGIWIKPNSDSAADTQAVLDEIMARTGLPLALEGIYRWIAFLPSRLDSRVPVANRYFGVFKDGSFKIRGIEARRHDTPQLIATMQMNILQTLADVDVFDRPLETCLPAIIRQLRQCLADLRAGQVELAQLLVTHRVSKTLEEFKVLSPAAQALAQLEAAGKQLRPGQPVRFLYTRGEPGVHPWNHPHPPDPATVDTKYYEQLLLRAAANLLQPFISEKQLREWILSDVRQLLLRPTTNQLQQVFRPGRLVSTTGTFNPQTPSTL